MMQYMYLARRDKSAVELLGVFSNKEKSSDPRRIHSIQSLHMEDKYIFKLANYYEDKKMMWEIFLENFEDFDDFRKKLFKRRYENIPTHAAPKLFNSKNPIMELKENKPKIMLQKKRFPDKF